MYQSIFRLPQNNIQDGENDDYANGTKVEYTIGVENVQVDWNQLWILYLVFCIRTQVKANGACDGSKENHCALEAVNVHGFVEEATDGEYQ
jgi:hypothetical protein